MVANETSSVSGDLPTDESKPKLDDQNSNNTTPSIHHDNSEVVSKPECFDVIELINDLGKDSKSPDKSEPAKQQSELQSEMNEAEKQYENKLPEGNSDHGKESEKDIHDNDANSVVQRSDLQGDKMNQYVGKTTDNVLTKEKISLAVHNILSEVEKLFATKF